MYIKAATLFLNSNSKKNACEKKKNKWVQVTGQNKHANTILTA